MIEKKVEVNLYQLVTETYDREAGKTTRVWGDWTDAYTEEPYYEDKGRYFISYRVKEISRTFTKFTNKGKLSKSDKEYTEEFAPFAERKFQQIVELEAQMADDQKRADELAEIVNAAYQNALPHKDDEDFESRLSHLSSKTSKSQWVGYELGHARSVYNRSVPTEVIDEAKELKSIRRKYQNVTEFDFYSSAYNTFETRIADHDNGR